MSRIEELINRLCPDGVEFKTLGELGAFYGGLTGKSKSDFTNGNAKFITYKNIYSNPALNTDIEEKVLIKEGEKQNYVVYGDILFTGSSETPDECGISSVITKHIDEKLYLNSFCFGFRLNHNGIFSPDFLKHLFRSQDLRTQIGKTANGVTRFNVSKSKMAKISIPIPPLEIQQEIVRILDNFTELSDELTNELTARKKQYEYYRDILLTFDKDDDKVKWMKLGEIGNISSGKNKYKKDSGQYPVYGSTGIIAYSDTYLYDKEQILIARVGANAGHTHIAHGKYDVSDNTLIVDIYTNFDIKYIYYTLVNLKLNTYAKGGGQPLITAGEIKKIFIPIPPLETQQRIVSILDRFDQLCNDLTAGLPAEIEARRKQYEYYRDKLLTFKEKKA